MERLIKEGHPYTMQMRVDQVAARASRANDEGDGPLEFLGRDNLWHEVTGGGLALPGVTWLHSGPDRFGYKSIEVVWVRWGLGDGMEWVEARELRVGDEVHNCGDVPWVVEALGERPNTAEPGALWVTAEGDSREGYYEKYLGAPMYYLAYLHEPVAVSWPRPARE